MISWMRRVLLLDVLPFNHCLLFRSAANLAAGESPATKRSISTSEDAETADGEPPVKRSEMQKNTFFWGEGRLSANYFSNCHHWISSNWNLLFPTRVATGEGEEKEGEPGGVESLGVGELAADEAAAAADAETAGAEWKLGPFLSEMGPKFGVGWTVPTVLITRSPFEVVLRALVVMIFHWSWMPCMWRWVGVWTNPILTLVTDWAASAKEQAFLLKTITVVNVVATFWERFFSNMTKSDHSIKMMSITVVIKWETETS